MGSHQIARGSLSTAAEESFLKEVDSTMTKIASEIEPRLKDASLFERRAEQVLVSFCDFPDQPFLGRTTSQLACHASNPS